MWYQQLFLYAINGVVSCKPDTFKETPIGDSDNCKVIRVNYAYNHIDVRPAYNK